MTTLARTVGHAEWSWRDELAAARTTDPNGTRVVLDHAVWRGRIIRNYPENASHLQEVLRAVSVPDHAAPDPSFDARKRSYALGGGPSRWLLVVVSYESLGGLRLRLPTGRTQVMERVNVTIVPLSFDPADYDADNDVLYLHVGEPQAGEGEETPEGHVVRYTPGTSRIVGLTVLGARRILKRDGHLSVTVPETVETTAEQLAHRRSPQRSTRTRRQCALRPVGVDNVDAYKRMIESFNWR